VHDIEFKPKATKPYQMNITSVNYNRTYAIGPFLNEKIGVEATIEPGDNPIEVLKSLKELADNFNKVANPHLEQAQPPEPEKLPIRSVDKVIEDFKALSVIEQMQSCKSPTVLKIYKNMLKTESEKLAYENKMNELLNQPITNGK